MSSTLVAVFDDDAAAAAARESLLEKRIVESSDINITRSESATAEMDRAAEDRADHAPHGIRAFFAQLFGLQEIDDLPGHYAEAVRRGGTILTVNVEDDASVDSASETLEEWGATDIDERVSRWAAEGYTGHDPNAPALSADELERERRKIKVLQEEIKVGKRTVSRGAVRVHRRLIETPVTEQVQLRSQEAVIERVRVDRPATEADLDTFKEAMVELHETTEEPVISKSVRVVEEITVGLKASERTETVKDTVRRTDVMVEQLDDGFQRPVEQTARDADAPEHTSERYSGPERRFSVQPFSGMDRRSSSRI